MNAYVDCTLSDDIFYTLNIWGKPVFSYILEEVFKSASINNVYIVSKSLYLNEIINEYFAEKELSYLEELPVLNELSIVISGTAILLDCNIIDDIIRSYYNGNLYGETHMDCVCKIVDKNNTRIKTIYHLEITEGLTIRTNEDFELAVVLKKKQNSAKMLYQQIVNRIQEKNEIIKQSSDGICLVGHSQMDFWNIEELGGMRVRNAGIGGISSFEYKKMILDNNMLQCDEDMYIVMHGTNDIVTNHTMEEIVTSIQETINYIKEKNQNAKIYFVECLSVNGRMDRKNSVIKELNFLFRERLSNCSIINVDTMNDRFGNLKMEYTCDGLHLSESGYVEFKKIIEKAMKE